ncbi:NmrA/HSCARG family protein [Streptomyces albiaxialis]|uniref:NmrA/HSCARG family protein n=1 Tax=Streptomyces albiaxialis TaxID=329523 RepID=A0ABN2W1M0_9ACTN
MTTTVLVTGATGQQGGATARHLLAAGWHVRALVRDPAAPAARALEAAGAELARGDMGDRPSLDRALRGAYGAFSVQPTTGTPGVPPDFTADDEVRLGTRVAEAAAEAGVRHLVYASVGGAERDPGIRRWETKWRIERRIAALGLPATVLRPVRFMENQADPRHGVGRDGVLSGVFEPGTPVQLIAADDIGAFAALALADPDHYVGRALELAGDELTMPRVAAAIGEATGRDVRYRPVSREDLADGDPDGPPAYDFANGAGGWRADIPMLRRLLPALKDFRTWLREGGPGRFAALSG